MSSIYTITGKLGGPFFIRPDDSICAMAVFANPIVAAAFIDASHLDNIEATVISSDTFIAWLDHVAENSITHIAVCPPSPQQYNLVPIELAQSLALFGTR